MIDGQSLPLVSVIVPTYNRPDQLAEALKSILAQTYKNIEIIVVNDCGEDVAYVIALLNDRNNIKYIRHDNNKGLAAARNTGIRAAAGKYIAYLDDDDLFYPNHVETLVPFLIRSGNKVAYASSIKAHQIKQNGRYVTVRRELAYNNSFDKDRILAKNLLPVLSIIHEKSCIERVGFFDETFTTLEDWDLWIRMSREYEFVHLPEVTSEVTWRTDGTTMTSSKRPDFLPSHKKIYDKHKTFSQDKPNILAEQKWMLGNLAFEIYGKTNNLPLVNATRAASANEPEPRTSINNGRTPDNYSPPIVSIVIPVHNNLDLTRQCIHSIQQTTSSGSCEVIVIDNASTDGTLRYLRTLDGYVKVIYNGTNESFSRACNQGMESANGRYILLLNNDTVATPGWLDALVREMESDPAIGIVGACLLYPNSSRIQHAGVVVGTWDNLLTPYHKHKLRKLEHVKEARQSRDCKVVTGACMLISRKVLEVIKGLDEGYRYGYEDVDFCFRAFRAGFRIRYCAGSILYHHESITPGRHDRDKVNYQRLVQLWQDTVVPDESAEESEVGLRNMWAREELETDPNRADFIRIVYQIAARSGNIEEAEEWRGRLLALSGPSIRENDSLHTTRQDSVTSNLPARQPRGKVVSIIVPAYNNVSLTKQCIESIRRTAAPGTYEIIVVDNASTDGTRDFLLEEQARGRLTALINDSNKGFAGACNAGARRSEARYVLFLNNDTIPKMGWLDALIRTAESSPEIGALGSKLLYPDGTIQHCGVVAGMRDGEPFPYHIYLCQAADAAHVNKPREFQMVTGACLMVKRDLFQLLGGFDEGYSNGHEDLDLCLRVRQAGKKVVYCPASELVHLEARTKRLIGLDDFHYRKGLDNEEGRGRRRFLEKWGHILQIDDYRYLREDGLIPEDRILLNGDGRKSCRKLSVKRILFMMYGWNDEGGGTILPRQIAKALAAQGYELSVIFTASRTRPEKGAYYVEESNEDGIRLFGIYNRPAIFYDLENPLREVDDPNMRRIVSTMVTHLRPDIVHYHSLLNFSMGVPEVVSQAGIPSVYTSHNYWPVCPRMYLFRDDLTLCSGPSNDGTKCAACIGRPEIAADYALRVERSRRMFDRHIDRHLAVSNRVRQIFIENGHSPDRIRVLHQQPETVNHIWQEVGSRRAPACFLERPLRVGFIGSLLPQKGVHVLVAAGQLLEPDQIEIHAFGSGPAPYLKKLEEIDRKNLVRLHGVYQLSRLPEILGSVDLVVIPSVWEDCAPLVVAEALAARVPVIGSRIGGIPDFIDAGVNGFLFEHGNPLALGGLLKRLVKDRAILRQLQRNITAGKGFNGYLAELLSHYNEVASSGSGKLVHAASNGSENHLSVKWEGSQFVHHSLALINRELCCQLIAQGHDLSIIPYEANEFEPGNDERYRSLARHVHEKLSRPADVHVRHQWPPNFTPPPQGHWVMIQPWEFGRLPEDWIGPMSTLVDEIWVPSRHVLKTYVSSGIPVDRVRVIPNGVNTRLFRPDAAPYPLRTEKSFKFLFVGGTIYRKGIDLLLETYRNSFNSRDDVVLVVKDIGQDTFYRSQGAGAVIRQIQEDRNAPEILYLADKLRDEQMPGLYTACDCLVHPYRGEGFGMPILESMACGLPVMVTSGGAADDFCFAETSFSIPSRRREMCIEGTPLAGGMGWMLEPDLEELKKLLVYVFNNRDEAREKARQALEHVADYTWEKIAEQVMARMREISGRPVRRSGG